ncbi:MAG: hypothetical protein PQJ59_08395 [Spirochaetales bacterium]|nr:hypothetical protein [Spirochaetales bacterium]
MRQDFWLFLGYLLGMGTMDEREEDSHRSLELAVSLNKPMKVSVGGESRECSLLALGPGVSHRIDGNGGWQFFGYLHPESRLGRLIMDKINASGRSWLYIGADGVERKEFISGLEEPSAYRVRELWEYLLSRLLGIKSYSLGWSSELKKMLVAMESLPFSELHAKSISEKLGVSTFELEETFSRIAGIPLTHFLFNRKLAHASDKIKKGWSLDEAINEAGLSGTSSVTEYIRTMYGLDMERLLTEKPFIRFFSVADYEQLSGHAL